ncbi:MAG: DNA polymerase III subunit alpha [Candidatus Omnitrophica bacterium]|nr:DNA polymerase III subunit alpha [Candidatus Omnitrophota bacterium]
MPHADFIHLHVHTQYSLLDGACRIPQLLHLAQQYKMDCLAITDHGNMFGAIDFYISAQKAGIKPIIGSEVYVAVNSRFEKNANQAEETSHHLVLLAKDEIGYHNLMKLISLSYLEGFYYRPRIDKELLQQYHQGLIALSACLKGQINRLLLAGRFNEALKVADDYRMIMGQENFYLELQDNSIAEQRKVNRELLRISKELKINCVATNDVHYVNREDWRAHEALLCIQTQTTLQDENRMRLSTDQFYFKSPQEMKALFSEVPQAIHNTLEIASRCNLELDFNTVHLPRYEPPEGKTKEEYLRQLCEEGLKKRYQHVTAEIRSRLEQELSTIQKMGFTSYFLIVWDFIHFAKENHIPVGPGRGSAAGSLVSYLLGITDIDPLKYHLLFERFLNPDRVSLPDIDIDFCYERRQEVIDYVTKKYGRSNVAQIITFGTMQARAVVRDVGRVMGLEYAEVDHIAKLIPPPDPTNPDYGLKEALINEPELKSLYQNDPQVKTLIDTALSLEGLNRHASVHAAGVVIADKPLDNYLPLYKTQDGQITTGYEMGALEKIGLLKVDFLGLRTLTVIEQTLKLIQKTRNINLDINTIALDDTATYRLLSQGQTAGVFQLESSGMRELLRKSQPSCFEDLIALLALYRPGPMGSGMLDDFIRRKNKQVPIKYDHPALEPILKDTYGIMVYQEQIMQVASTLAGFTLAQADLLRRAIAKKIPEVMEQQRKEFISGCIKNRISEKTANKIFDQIVFFSGYGFNRSHSAAYAVISYRTAYLKANYPIEFMTALLSSERDNTDKIVEYVNECQRMGIEILPPSINESEDLFSVENLSNKQIRFGLLAIKNVGRAAVETLLTSRREKGKFKSLEDICQRVDLRQMNRKVLESLIKCGALDCFKKPRAQMFAQLDSIIEAASRYARDKARGQLSLFDTVESSLMPTSKQPTIKEWPEPQLLSFEKELLGFYISGHPLSRYAGYLKRFSTVQTGLLAQLEDGAPVKIVGLITKIKVTLTRKRQEKMAIIILEDLHGVVEVIVFPAVYSKISRLLIQGTVVMVKGKVNLRENTPKVICDDILSFDDVYKQVSSVRIDLTGIKGNLFESLKEILLSSQGQTPVYLNLTTAEKSKLQLIVGQEFFVQPNEQLITNIENLIGQDRVVLTM